MKKRFLTIFWHFCCFWSILVTGSGGQFTTGSLGRNQTDRTYSGWDRNWLDRQWDRGWEAIIFQVSPRVLCFDSSVDLNMITNFWYNSPMLLVFFESSTDINYWWMRVEILMRKKAWEGYQKPIMERGIPQIDSQSCYFYADFAIEGRSFPSAKDRASRFCCAWDVRPAALLKEVFQVIIII